MGRESGRGNRGNGRSSGRKGFSYKPRSADAIDKRASQSAFDNGPSLLKGDIPMWKPKDGTNTIRILPPTWDDAEHFGLDVHVHYQIGADKQNMLALHENLGEKDPVYEERLRAEADGDSKYAQKLKAKKRVLYYLIDRDEEDKGVQAWFASWTIDKDLNAICVHKRSGEIYQIDDPECGYDISFEKKGKGMKTEYTGFQLDRRESDLGDDSWLDFAVENPLPDMLNYLTYEEQDRIFAGGAAVKAGKDEDDKPAKSRGRGRGRDEEEEEEETGNSRTEGDYDYDEVLAMDFPDLEDILDAEGLDIDPADYEDDEAEELAKDILAELGIEPPKKKVNARGGRGRGRDDRGARDKSSSSPRGRGRGRDEEEEEEEEEDNSRSRLRSMSSRRQRR